MAETLGLIAGSGRLPFEVADAAGRSGLRVAIVAIEGNTDPAIEDLASAGFEMLAVGELQRVIDFLHAAGVQRVVLAGAVAKREMFADPAALRLDARALHALAGLEGTGDDALLRSVARELESEGLEIISSTAPLGDRLVKEGVAVGGPIGDALARDLELGLRVAKTLGRHDVGQGVAVAGGTVLAVEALEGTDVMMRRAGGLASGAAVALVKAAKPGQDLRFDVPAIGPGTIAVAADCGVKAIGLEAGATIVLEPEATYEAARRAGIAIVGLRAEAS